MDIKAKAEDLINKIKTDKDIKEKFEKDPVKVIEDLIGIDLPDEMINNLIDTVKAKLSADALGDIADKVTGLFGKK